MTNSTRSAQFNQLAWLFVVAFVMAMFLPRVVIEGMFADGLCYSSISRNLAEGKGSIWAPYFSTSFWLPYNEGTIYYENMPMLFWLQAPFFWLLGDAWWVEKLFCVVLVLCTALLMNSTWKATCTEADQRPFGWLAQFFLYTVPIILWAYPFNQLDTLMAFFTLLSIKWGVQATLLRQTKYWILTGFGCFLAFLAKGPVGVFPLVMPMLGWLILREETFARSMVQNLIVIASFVGFMLAMCLYEPAFEYLEHFLDQQLFSALAGKREGGEDPMNRLYIFQQIIMQNAPIVALSLIVWLIGRHKVKAPVSKWVVFFALLGIIGSVPIAISPKQHEIYLIPAATCFALAAAWFVFPYVKYWTESVRFSPSLFRNLRLFMWLLIAGVLVYTTTEIKKPGREIEVLADMPQLAKHVPEGATIGACTTMMADFVVHGYLQRYHHWGLTPDPKVPIYFLTQEDCGHEFEQELLARGFNLVPLTTQRFKLWKK